MCLSVPYNIPDSGGKAVSYWPLRVLKASCIWTKWSNWVLGDHHSSNAEFGVHQSC